MDILRTYCVLLLLFLEYSFVTSECWRNVDPCNATVYVEIDQPDRSTGFVVEVEAATDYYLEEAWYRSVSGAGPDMPTSLVETGQCNAYAPIYLTESLPTSPAQGVVELSACAAFLGDPCARPYIIPVKNCGNFNVYCLSPVVDFFDRYCMGSEVPCPAGQISQSGFTPCVDESIDVTLDNDPEISYDVAEYEDNSSPILTFCIPFYEFKCDVVHTDSRVFIDVEWYADGTLIQETRGVPYDSLPNSAILTSRTIEDHQYYFGTTLTCRLSARESTAVEAQRGNYVQKDFHLGAQITDDSRYIELGTNGNPGYYTGEFTIPLRCPYRCGFVADCNLDIILSIPSSSPTTPADCTNYNVLIEDDRGCNLRITDQFHFSVPVYANSNHNYNRLRRMTVQLKFADSNSPGLSFFGGYEFPPAQVIIHNNQPVLANSRCRVFDDPHITSFDGRRFEVQLEGAFVLYKHTTLPILVEVYFKRFRRSGRYEPFTRNCGGAVRSGGQVFVYDDCREDAPRRAKLYQCESGLTDMVVAEFASNNYVKYKVTLATGTVVVLGKKEQYVDPSHFDFGLTEGLCGNFNGDPADSDDKIIKGTTDYDRGTTYGRNHRYKEYNDFSNSWRVDDSSLYSGKLTDSGDFAYSDTVFCGCGADFAECSTIPNVERCIPGDHSFLLGDNPDHRCTRKKRATEPTEEDDIEMFAYDPTFAAEPLGWTDEWDEDTAAIHCLDLFQASLGAVACQQIPTINATQFLEACVLDIFITGSSELSEIHLNGLLDLCMSEVQNYVFDTTETEEQEEQILPVDIALEIRNDVCPGDCLGRGVCSEGACICNTGYTGVDCSIHLNHVPVLFDLPANATCDRSRRPCQTIRVNADQYIAHSTYCRLSVREFDDDQSTEPTIVPATYVHMQEIICNVSAYSLGIDALPDRPYIIEIAASNNGVDFSDVKALTVFDRKCWSCFNQDCLSLQDNRCFSEEMCYLDGETLNGVECKVCHGASGNWDVQETACLIGDSCIEGGVINPLDDRYVCDPSRDQFSWQQECVSLNLTHDTTALFDLRITRADNKDQLNFNHALLGSDTSLKLVLEDTNEARMKIRLDNDETFRVKRFCVDTKHVKKMKLEFYDPSGEKVQRFSGKPRETCMWHEDVANVSKMELKFKKKSRKTFIKLDDMFMEACYN